MEITKSEHGLTPDNLIKNFKVIKKCRGKLECLIFEMLWINNKRPKLNTQADSIRAKLFPECFHVTFANIYFLTSNFYKYAFPLFLIYLFDNDDMKSSKRHVVLLSLIFLLTCFSKSFFIKYRVARNFCGSLILRIRAIFCILYIERLVFRTGNQFLRFLGSLHFRRFFYYYTAVTVLELRLAPG